jgi:DinB superfamily
MIERPTESEYAPFYAGYVSKVPSGDVLEMLESQRSQILALAATVPAERETFRYAPGKWTVREVFGHLGDAERVFGYRAFCISRGDQTPLPGFDEQEYVAASGFNSRALSSLAQELALLRESNLAFLRHLGAEEWQRTGVANANPISVRALAFIMVGHVNHHLGVLRERYGVEAG